MKISLMVLTIFLGSAAFSSELAWVDEQVEAIKPPRSGVSEKVLSITQDPFVFLQEISEVEKKKLISNGTTPHASTSKAKPKKRTLTLWLILNKTAKIDDHWHKEGDKLAGYKVEIIGTKSVLLTKNNKKLLLSTRSSSTNLKFKNK